MNRPLALLVNPTAARGKALAAVAPVRAELDRLGTDYRVIETSSGEHASREARSAAADGPATVVAIGGDGLVGTLAGALTDTDSALAIVPAGRGNDFARVLGIPTDPAQAARVAATGEAKPLDVGRVDGKSFVGIASAGFDSDANRIANEAKLIRGNLVYAYAALRALVSWKAAHFTVTIDGETREHSGYTVAVANSKAYGGGMFMAPDAELDDGQLDVVVIGGHSKTSFLRRLPTVFKGTHVNEPEVETFRGTTIELRADRPFTVYADGDPLAQLPATVTVAPRALNVVLPKP